METDCASEALLSSCDAVRRSERPRTPILRQLFRTAGAIGAPNNESSPELLLPCR